MTVTAFLKDEILLSGTRDRVAEAIRALPPLARSSDLLVFEDDSGRQIDLDPEAMPAAPRRRGRPALGVEAREVTLLPRHWEWLAGQPGGASVTLRKLVEQARKAGRSERDAKDAAFRFLNVMAGDRPHFEEAVRALYAGDRVRFMELMAQWPVAVRDHALGLAFPTETPCTAG